MANLRFGHRYELLISRPPNIVKTPEKLDESNSSSKVVNDQGFQDFRTSSDLDTVTITDLQITATTAGNIKGSTSNSTITIWGVGAETLSYIKANSYVILKGGYEQDNSLLVLFVGQVITVTESTDTGNSKVSLVCKDAVVPTSSVKVTKSWPKDTTYSEILDYLANVYVENGLPRANSFSQITPLTSTVINIPLDQKKAVGGLSVMGYLDTVLDDVCKSVGFVNYIASGKLYIEPDNYNKTSEQFILEEDIIQTIRRKTDTKDGSSKGTGTTKNVQGFYVRTFLDGRMDVGKYVRIRSSVVDGLFKIVNTKHTLDYEGVSWFTEIEVQSV